MLSLNLSFRRLVLKYIPQLISKDLDKYESLTALRHQISEDVRTLSTADPIVNQKREDSKESSTHEANITIRKNFIPNVNNYKRVQKLYMAKRQYALQQGNYLQVPSSPSAFWKYINAAINYRNVQIQTLPFLWANRLIYFITNFWSQVSFGLVILIGIILTQFINWPPEIVSIPQDTVSVGQGSYKYQVFATDPDLDDSLTYSFANNPLSFSISSDSGLIFGPLVAGDDGFHSISIVVSDIGGLSDTQNYTLTVSP